jgi:nucleoside-diphosphate-sugar epimerase
MFSYENFRTKMKRIIISGATGMIGSSIARIALEQGYEVLCIARGGSKQLKNIAQSANLRVIYADLNDYSKLKIEGVWDAFIFCAWNKSTVPARDDAEIQMGNIKYTLDAVHVAKRAGCRVFVGTGSQAEYGLVSKPLTSYTPVNPQSGYGIAKFAAGKLSRLLCYNFGMRHIWLRILSVFGLKDSSSSLIMYTINELQAGRTPEFTKCEQIWDYLYCDDVASAVLEVAEKGVNGKSYPLGSGKFQKLSEYIKLLRDIVNPNGLLQFGKKEYYPHQPMYLCADISELTADTGWKPNISFEDGIKRILKDVRK